METKKLNYYQIGLIIIISNAFTNSDLHITISFAWDVTSLLQFLIWSGCIENYTKILKLKYIQNCDNKPDFPKTTNKYFI
jgi:hypothetical protein